MKTVTGTDVTIRSLEPSDVPEVVELLRAAMGEAKVPLTVDYWRWKHEQSPFGPSPGLVAVAPDGRLVGVRVFMRWELWRGEERLRAVRAVDTATHPDWQGKGIFTRLTRGLLAQAEAEGVDFVFNTPNKSSLPGYLKMGWVDTGRVTVWAKPSMRGLLRGALASTPGPGARSDLSPADKLLQDPRVPSLLEGITTERARSGRLHTRADLPYLSWRYARVPNFEYFGGLTLRGSSGALAIGRQAQRGPFREALLSDVLATPDLGGSLALAGLLRSTAAALNCGYLVAVGTGPSERRGLLLGGFLPAPRAGLRLTLRSLARPVDGLRSAWTPSVGELELL